MKFEKDSVIAKAVTGFVAIATGAFMLGLAVAPTANAQTSAELQAQIESLLEQIATLQSQLNAGTGTSGLACDFSFTRDLSLGSTGADVMNLQEFLNSVPGVQVAASGVGSAGSETSYYGTLTAQAVSAFQVKYSSEILAPLGLTSGTGYWGASSRSKARDLCETGADTGSEVCGDGVDNDGDGFVDEGCDADDDDEDTGDLSGGEGSLTEFETLAEYSNEDITQGQTEKVFGFKFEANGSDVSVRRVDILFEANDDNSTSDDDAKAQPWDFAEKLSLYHGDDLVAEMDADSSGDWSKVSTASLDGDSTAEGDDDTYRMRFTGISEKVDEDASSEWTLEVEARDVLDTGDIPQDFEIAVADDGIRAVDAAGINIYGGSDSSAYQVTMTFDETTAGDLDLTSSDDFDEDVVAEVTDTDGSETENVSLGKFELDAEHQDVTIEDLGVDVVINAGDDVDQLVNTVRLYADGTLLKTENVSSSAASTTVTFDDIDFTVDEDETVAFEVKGDLNDLNSGTNDSEGEEVYIAVFGENIDADDAEGDTVTISQDWNNGSSPTKVTVYSTLPTLTLTSTDAEAGADDGSGNVNKATYTFKFDVKAVGGDIYIPDDALGTTTTTAAEAGTSNEGVEVQIVSSGTASSGWDGDAGATLTSSATKSGSYFKITEGSTKSFTATVNYDHKNASADAFQHAQFWGLNWDTSAQTPTKNFTSGFDDWETDSIFLDK